MFRITDSRGFHMTFENGWTASVQWGAGNYCDNRSFRVEDLLKPKPNISSTTAEVAAWDADGRWYNFGADTVFGYRTPDEVARFIAQVASFPAAAPKALTASES